MEKELTVKTFDGIELRGRVDFPDTPKAVCLVIHGIAEHYGRYDYLTDKLNTAGFAVVRFDQRGHGRSDGRPVYYSDYTEIIKDIDLLVKTAREEFGDLPLFIIGHSMGGFGAVVYGTANPGKADAYIISGALTRSTKRNPLLDSPLDDDAYVPNGLGGSICSDSEVVAAYAADPLVAKELSVKIIRAMNAGIDWLKESAELFVDPILILHGANDRNISPKESLLFFDEIASSDKSLRIYSDLMHDVFNERAKDRVIRDAIEWMDDRS